MATTAGQQELNRARDIVKSDEDYYNWAYQTACNSAGDGAVIDQYSDGVDGTVETRVFRMDIESHGLSVYYARNDVEGVYDVICTRYRAAVL